MNRNCLVWMMACLAALTSGCAEREVVDPLPELEDISKVEVYQMYIMVDGQDVIAEQFQMPKEYWQELLNALKPAQIDPDPLTWVFIGYVDFETTNGEVTKVHLYYVSEDDGAFSIEKNEHERPYYRGGNSAALKNVLHKAYLAIDEQ